MVGEKARSLVDLPFEERRYIAVVTDEEFERRAEQADGLNTEGSVWPVLGVVGSSLVPGGLIVRAGLMGASLFLASRFTKTENACDAPALPAKKAGFGAIRPVRMKDTKQLKIPSGSVEIGEVYAANPVMTHIYYPMRSYNDDMLDHKLSELERILNSLGAKHYSIKFEEEGRIVSNVRASARKFFKAEADHKRSRKRRFERSGTADGRDPVLPDGLVWYDREPAWQGLAESRLCHGRREFGLTIELEQSLTISARVAADIKKYVQLDVGVKRERDASLTLSVTGSF